MNLRKVLFIIPTVLLCVGCGGKTPPTTTPYILQSHEIVLQVRPKWAMGVVGSFRAKVTIDNNIDNRALVFVYDGPMHRASYIQLDEFNADQKTFDFLMEQLPSGQYTVQATLLRRVKGELVSFVDSTDIMVCGPSTDSCGDGK